MKRKYISRIILLLLFLICGRNSVFAQTQQVYIQSFTHDMSRAAKDNPREDASGNLYAVVKVRTADGSPMSPEFNYDFYYSSHINDGQHEDEVWLYVQRDARKIKISREGFATIREKDLGITIQSGETYILVLSYVEPQLQVQKQWLRFNVKPSDANAIIKVRRSGSSDNYEIWDSPARNLECGLYDYQISAENYDLSEGRVMLNQANETFSEEINLIPNFGFLQIDDEQGIAGAQIYVDDKPIGKMPYKSDEKWTCGEYNLEITNGELYKTYRSTFSIEKGKTTVLRPHLASNAAETYIRVNADADIYIDKVLKGRREWRGPLKAGNYEVECRMDKHKSVTKTITVIADEVQDVLLDTPAPITGMLSISSNPLDAEIRVDGNTVGTTPMTIKDLIIGQHTVSVSLKNHKTEQRTINIEEGRTENLNITLSDMADMKIVSQPSGAMLYLNGERKGTTPYSEILPSGDYDLKLEHSKYRKYEKRVHFDSSNPTLNIKMDRQYQQPSCFYIQPTFQVGAYSAFGAEVGAYFANVNIEASYLLSSDSETLYWNYTGSQNGKRPVEEVFSPSYFGAKVGYGLCYGTRFRLTPQIGIGCLSVKGDQQSKGYSTVASAGARIDYALTSCIGVNLTPEFGFGINESSIFSELTKTSNEIGAWNSGFNLKIGVYVFF